MKDVPSSQIKYIEESADIIDKQWAIYFGKKKKMWFNRKRIKNKIIRKCIASINFMQLKINKIRKKRNF